MMGKGEEDGTFLGKGCLGLIRGESRLVLRLRCRGISVVFFFGGLGEVKQTMNSEGV